jgi:signal transduction histidine kinase
MTIQSSVGLDGKEIYICAALDITERKRVEVALRESEAKNRLLLETLRQSEEELRSLAGSLLAVQEEERRRIARDLHDDITQELAAVSIDIGTLAATCPVGGDLSPRLRSLQGRIAEVCSVVRHVSHGLHPSMLEDLGLSAALEEFCEEFSKTEGILVEYDADEDDDALSVTEASCLYRIAQESLRNVAKHANASHVKVELRSNGKMVRLSIRDNGVGIGAISSDACGRAGLGLVSMKERMRLINGTLSVISSPGEGTRVIGCVPLRVIGRETIAHTAGR